MQPEVESESLLGQQLKSCILVLGADRKAAAPLTQILALMGAEPPRDWTAEESSSPTAIHDLNSRLLGSAGTSWDDFAPFHTEWRDSPAGEEFLQRAVSLLGEQFEDASLIVLEDPGISRVVPFWIEALDRVGYAIKPIIVIRNPLEFVESYEGGSEWSHPLRQIVWLRQVLDAEEATRGRPRFYASYERLLQGWEAVILEAQEALQLSLPKAVDAVEFEVEKLLKGDLRQAKEAQARASTSKLLPDWLRQTYKIVNGWAMSEEMPAHHALLDKIRTEFDVASRAFSRLVRVERKASGNAKELRCEQLEAELLQAAEGLATLEAEALALRVVASEASAELDGVKRNLQEQRRITTLQSAELHQMAEGREDLEAQLRDARDEIAASRARRKEMARVIGNRDAQLQARYEELATLQRKMLRLNPLWRVRKWFGA